MGTEVSLQTGEGTGTDFLRHVRIPLGVDRRTKGEGGGRALVRPPESNFANARVRCVRRGS